MKKLQLGLVALVMMQLVGCAAISEKEGLKIVNSNNIVVFKVVNANNDAKNSVDALLDADNKFMGNGASVLSSLGGKEEVIKNYYAQCGLLKYTYSKTFNACVFLPKKDAVNKGDLIMGSFQGTGIGLKFIKIVARNGDNNKDCYWDGSGVICPQEHWDYRKDLPEAMK